MPLTDWLNPIGGVVSSLGGAAMGGKAAEKAAKSQERSAGEALKFQREQEAARKANFDRAYDLWNQSRNMLAQRYGINLGAAAAPPGATAVPSGLGAPAGPPPQAAGVARSSGFVPPAVASVYQGRSAGPGGPGFIPELQGITLGDLMTMNRGA